MTYNLLMFSITGIALLTVCFSIVKFLLRKKKRTAESIYKLIDDLEKKYIY